MDFKSWRQDIETWYNAYVSGYLTAGDEENIIIKRDHSLRVCANMVQLATALGCNDSEQQIAAVIGILHDVGRFEQIRRYGTFSDARSVSHAALGVEILDTETVLNSTDADIRELVITAIRHHSALRLPSHLTGKTLFFCQLIRDADKLDIFKVVTDYYQRASDKRNPSIELDLVDDAGYNPAMLDAICRKEDVDYRKAQNLNDFKILQAGWVFSLYFTPTLVLLRKRGYLTKLRAALPRDDGIDALFEIIGKHQIAE